MRSTTHTIGVLAAFAIALAACAGSSDGTTVEGPDVTLGTVPSAPADDGNVVAVTDSADVSASESADSGEVEEGPTSTLAPTASPGADLPTQAPGSEPAPVTTLPGPLPTPAVRLIEAGQFDEPVGATTRPGDGRLFVVERTGGIEAFDDLSNDRVLDLRAIPDFSFTDAGGEQGLLGVAFHPEADLAYIDFTNADGATVIAEFAIDPLTARFDPATYREVLVVDQPFANHNGGHVIFGPDSLLYIGLGDGGAADDPDRSALDLSQRLGKILRIDPTPSGDAPFTIPPDNPFVGVEGADPAIWSLGLRNPWRFTFDRLTGDLWIADVGQNRWEEIDLAPAVDGRDAGRGISFGWSAFEAADRFNEDQFADGHVLPVVSYAHENDNCSVSGGAVARDASLQELNGWYVYGDYCSGRVWALDTTSVTSTSAGPVGDPIVVEIATVPALTSVAEGPYGDLYATSGAGPVYRLTPT